MKAFLLAVVVMVAVALGANYGLDGIWGEPASQAFKSDNVRLN